MSPGNSMAFTLVCASLRRGGAERVLSTLANELCARHAVTLVTLEKAVEGEYPLNDRVVRIALDVSRDSRGVVDAIRANLRRIRALRRAIAASDPDVVVSFIHRMNVTTLIACRGLAAPVIVSERSDPRMAPLGWGWRALRRLTYRSADYVVCQTRSAADWMQRVVPAARIRIIANPVRLDSMAADPIPVRVRPYIVGVGRLSIEKGFDLLIEAFAHSRARQTHDLLIVGDGRERARLETLGTTLGLGSTLVFVGQVAQPEPWLAGADIFVLPSRFEGFPNALIEAMSFGRCVLAFDCQSGPSDIITDGADGILVSLGDTAALAAAIDRVAGDGALRNRLGVSARAVRKRYALPVIAASWEALARNAYANRKSRPEGA